MLNKFQVDDIPNNKISEKYTLFNMHCTFILMVDTVNIK